MELTHLGGEVVGILQDQTLAFVTPSIKLLGCLVFRDAW